MVVSVHNILGCSAYNYNLPDIVFMELLNFMVHLECSHFMAKPINQLVVKTAYL